MYQEPQIQHPLEILRREMDRLLTESARPAWPIAVTRSFPAINVWEDEETVNIEAEVPGLKQQDLELTLLGNELSIRGKLHLERPEKASLHRKERPEGEFTRIAHLPVEVDGNKVEASLLNGVLTIRLQKAEAARPRKIEIRSH
jgi:HSP20 family protein